MTKRSNPELYCSFCGKSRTEVRKLFEGPTVFICNECVALAVSICLSGCSDSKSADLGAPVEALPVEPARDIPERPLSRNLCRWAAWEVAAHISGGPDDALAEEYALRLRAFVDKPPPGDA